MDVWVLALYQGNIFNKGAHGIRRSSLKYLLPLVFLSIFICITGKSYFLHLLRGGNQDLFAHTLTLLKTFDYTQKGFVFLLLMLLPVFGVLLTKEEFITKNGRFIDQEEVKQTVPNMKKMRLVNFFIIPAVVAGVASMFTFIVVMGNYDYIEYWP